MALLEKPFVSELEECNQMVFGNGLHRMGFQRGGPIGEELDGRAGRVQQNGFRKWSAQNSPAPSSSKKPERSVQLLSWQ